MNRVRPLAVVIAALAALAVTLPAAAYDPEQTFKDGTFVLSFDGGGGSQLNAQDHSDQSGITLWWFQNRFAWIPGGPIGRDTFLYGAFEAGFEAVFQKYVQPSTYFAGLGAAFRYHFLGLGRFVPYLEVGGAPGYENLRVKEIKSEFAFRVYAGLGASVFVSDNAAIYMGARVVHVSNGNTASPNRGFEALSGALGVSFFFP